MFEVAAKLNNGQVYLSAETIHCTLKFTNVADGSSQSNLESESTIALVSAQIHCFCHINETRINISQSNHNDNIASGTSFVPEQEEQGFCVYQSPVKVLFCDCQLLPGQSMLHDFSETLPSDIPPSYRGRSCRYSYKLTIGTQRVGKKIQLLRIPFRVLVLYGLSDYLMNQSSVPSMPSNPFLDNPATKLDLKEIARDQLDELTSRKSFKKVQIKNKNGEKIGIFTLAKNSAKIGDNFIGHFDFSDSDISCVEYTCCLQSEEIVSEEYRKFRTQANMVSSYSKFNEFCLFTKKTHVLVPVPLHVTPNCLTDIICLKWKIHFEFTVMTSLLSHVTNPLPNHHHGNDGDGFWQGPTGFETEVSAWDVPVRILPNLPSHAQNPASSNFIYMLQF